MGRSWLPSFLSLVPKAFAEVGASAVQEGADGRLGFVHDLGDFWSGEFVEGGEEQGLALGLGKAIDGVEDALRLLRFVEGLIGWGVATGEGCEDKIVGLIGLGAAAAVESEIPGDADQPGAKIADGGKVVLVLEDAEKGVLNSVFGFRAIAEDGMGDAEESGCMGSDERRQIHLGCGGFGELRQGQT